MRRKSPVIAVMSVPILNPSGIDFNLKVRCGNQLILNDAEELTLNMSRKWLPAIPCRVLKQIPKIKTINIIETYLPEWKNGLNATG